MFHSQCLCIRQLTLAFVGYFEGDSGTKSKCAAPKSPKLSSEYNSEHDGPVKFVACVRLQERPCLIFRGWCVELREQTKQKGPRLDKSKLQVLYNKDQQSNSKRTKALSQVAIVYLAVNNKFF